MPPIQGQFAAVSRRSRAAVPAVALALMTGLGFGRPALAAPSAFPRAADETSLSDAQLLGKRIFEDATLSEPQGMSCMSCHAPDKAFQGNNGSPIAAVAAGSTADKLGTRKVPTLMYKAFSPAFGVYREIEDGVEKTTLRGGQFWDGRALNLIEQASGPLLNPVEMNNPSAEAVVAKVKAGPYADLFTAVHGAEALADPKLAMAKISEALFTFEVSPRFAPFSSKFDDTLRGTAKLTAQEKRGLALFSDPKKGNCISCHAGKPESDDPTDWLFTDFTYDALGVPRNRAIPANADAETFDLGLCKREGLAPLLPAEIPLDSLCGAFKVPTLRNVAVTGPYFHNGGIATLRDAVAFYATRDTDPKRWYPKGPDGKVVKFDDVPAVHRDNVNTREKPYDRHPGQKPRLDDRDIDDLVAFLGTLTDKGVK